MSVAPPSTPPTKDNAETQPCENFHINNNTDSQCETTFVNEDTSSKDENATPSGVSEPTLDNQEQNVPTTQARESGSDECIFIPKHAVVDDISLKFILHPKLASDDLKSGSSLEVCKNEDTRQGPYYKERTLSLHTSKDDSSEILDASKTPSHGIVVDKFLHNKKNASNSSSVQSSNESEQYVIKTAKEILYDIAKGKWNRKGMIIDEETEGTKKISSKPCSNANCVRAAERERRRKQHLLYQNQRNMETQTVFENGQLPSYHSMLNVWKYQEEGQKQHHTWLQGAFKNGFPENETEFLKVWRECRKNPEAFGIRKSEPKPLPDVQERRFGSRVRKIVKPYEKRLLIAEAVKNPPPVRLASKEYYSPEWKPTNSQDREAQKKRYDALRKLYPHLPALRSTDFKMNPATVRYRLRQAEEWHKLVTISNKPKPMLQLSYYAADIKRNSGANVKNEESRPESVESSELDFQTYAGTPRYATSTASRMSKVIQRQSIF